MKKIFFLLPLFFSISFYGQNDTLADVKVSNIGVISVDKLNVVYHGLENPISIAVPNCKSFEAKGKYLTKISEGKYKLYPDYKVSEIKNNIRNYIE